MAGRKKIAMQREYFDPDVVAGVDNLLRIATSATYLETGRLVLDPAELGKGKNRKKPKLEDLLDLWGLIPGDLTDWRKEPGRRRLRPSTNLIIGSIIIDILSGTDYSSVPAGRDHQKVDAVRAYVQRAKHGRLDEILPALRRYHDRGYFGTNLPGGPVSEASEPRGPVGVESSRRVTEGQGPTQNSSSNEPSPSGSLPVPASAVAAPASDSSSATEFIPWLTRMLPDRGLGPSRTSPWPVTAGSIGLQRTHQIVVCFGVDPHVLLAELRRVEGLLESIDTQQLYPRRSWALGTGWSAEVESDGAVVELSLSEAAGSSTDTVEGLIQEHFASHRDSRSASVVLALPPNGLPVVQQLAETLRSGPVEAECAALVDVVGVTGSWDSPSLKPGGVALLQAMQQRIATHTERAEVAPSETRFRQSLEWLAGRTSDEEFFRVLAEPELRVAVLAGRFGISGERPMRNAIHRAAALIRAVPRNDQLPFALGSLPMETEIVEALVEAPDFVRAVAGLIRADEWVAGPARWFHQPIESWRHGRALSMGG